MRWETRDHSAVAADLVQYQDTYLKPGTHTALPDELFKALKRREIHRPRYGAFRVLFALSSISASGLVVLLRAFAWTILTSVDKEKGSIPVWLMPLLFQVVIMGVITCSSCALWQATDEVAEYVRALHYLYACDVN